MAAYDSGGYDSHGYGGESYNQHDQHDQGDFRSSPSGRMGGSGYMGSSMGSAPRQPGTGSGSYGVSPKRYGMPYRVDRQRAWNMQMLHSKLQEAETTIESTRSRLLQARLEASNPDAEHADDYYEQDAYGYDDEYDEYDDFEEQLAPEIDQSKLEITEGPIKKRARGRFTTKRWADRYMRVTRAHLEYFDDAEKSMSRGTIYLDEDAEVFPGDSKGVHKNRDVVHTFTIALAGKEPLVIAVDTEEEMEQWVQTIQYIIDQHKEHTDPERREERRRQRRASSRRGMPGGQR